MALKVDNSQNPLSIVVDGVATPVAGDVQVFELITTLAGAATVVGAANPLPTKNTHGKTILHGAISFNTAGDHPLATPTIGKIKVIGMVVVCAAVVTATLLSATVAEGGQAALTGPLPFTANGGWQDRGKVDEYILETATLKSLVLNLSGAVQVSGYYSYVDE